MNKVLVAYATVSGSTAEMAEFIGKEISKSGAQVDVLPVLKVKSIAAYDSGIVGGPMIMGWHPEMLNFLKQNKAVLQSKRVACFIAALTLTVLPDTATTLPQVYTDPSLAKLPKDARRMSFKENYARVENYLKPAAAMDGIKPLGYAFFNGALKFSRLNLFQKLFVKFIVGAKEGDYRNWDALRKWAADLTPKLA